MSDEAASSTPSTGVTPPPGRGLDLGDTLRAVAIAALAGAAVIHFAYAPAHFDEQTSHGVFFLAVAWGQVAATLALVGVVSASVTPSIAGDHLAAAGHGEHDGQDEAGADGHGGHDHGTEAAAMAPEDRCDLGFNTVSYNAVARPGEVHAHDDDQPVDFTLEQWVDVFVDPRGPVSAEAVMGYLESNPVQRDGVLSGGLTHTLAPDPWIPMTDEAECEQLADELGRAREVATAFPTAADAEAAGYRKITNYYPGIAAHYINEDHVDERFEIEEPEMLLYDGDGPNAGMVGLSYYVLSEDDGPPSVGFTGPNDHYHRHLGLCFRDGVVISGSNTSEEECEAEGGTKGLGFDGWMNHVWIVPGCESDWGLYSGANPALTVRGLDNSGDMPTGCGTGLPVDGDLALDSGGDGPHL